MKKAHRYTVVRGARMQFDTYDEIRCNYMQCYAGMGVAGMLYCFLGGDYTNENCDKFLDEDKEYTRHKEAE